MFAFAATSWLQTRMAAALKTTCFDSENLSRGLNRITTEKTLVTCNINVIHKVLTGLNTATRSTSKYMEVVKI